MKKVGFLGLASKVGRLGAWPYVLIFLSALLVPSPKLLEERRDPSWNAEGRDPKQTLRCTQGCGIGWYCSHYYPAWNSSLFIRVQHRLASLCRRSYASSLRMETALRGSCSLLCSDPSFGNSGSDSEETFATPLQLVPHR